MALSDDEKKRIKKIADERAKYVWPLYDRIIELATTGRPGSPWSYVGERSIFTPDFDVLEDLLRVPLWAMSSTQSQLPAKALDVWIAHELRRAGFEMDAVWPRPTAPRFVPKAIMDFISGLQRKGDQTLVRPLLGSSSATGADARVFGKNYRKQIDVGMSNWDTGPEILISSKRMDSSFGNNAANRVEEAYGDAKNLRLRHPLAAVGFVYSLRSTVLDEPRPKDGGPTIHEFLVDLLTKLGREEDAYNAVALVMPDYEIQRPLEDDAVNSPAETLMDAGLTSAGPSEADLLAEKQQEVSIAELDQLLVEIPRVTLNHAEVPDELSPDRFFEVIVRVTLSGTPVSQHRRAREMLRAAEFDDGAATP